MNKLIVLSRTCRHRDERLASLNAMYGAPPLADHHLSQRHLDIDPSETFVLIVTVICNILFYSSLNRSRSKNNFNARDKDSEMIHIVSLQNKTD